MMDRELKSRLADAFHAPEPEKKKKRGFFSRLFGGKDDD